MASEDSITIFVNDLPLIVKGGWTPEEVSAHFVKVYPDELVKATNSLECYDKAYQEHILNEGPVIKWRGCTLTKGTHISSMVVEPEELDLPFSTILFHRTTAPAKVVTNILGEGTILAFEGTGTSVRFHSTFRIPDDGNTYPLPPSLGDLKLFGLGDDHFVLPLWQREAMWLSFHSVPNTSAAIKIFVGDVNAITGEYEPDHAKDILRVGKDQNYVGCPQQKWLDGIRTEPRDGTIPSRDADYNVRQFVAMPLHDPSTIESQLKVVGYIPEIKGGLSFRVFSQVKIDTEFKVLTPKGLAFGFDNTPARAFTDLESRNYVVTSQSHLKSRITLFDIDCVDGTHFCWGYPTAIFVKTFTNKTCVIDVNDQYACDTMSVQALKQLLYDQVGFPPDQQRLIFEGKQLTDGAMLSKYDIRIGSMLYLVMRLRGGGPSPDDVQEETRMGLSVGGLIRQKIYSDYSSHTYDTRRIGRCTLTLANSALFPKPLPRPSVTYDDYIAKGYPWFELYDDDLKSIPSSSSLPIESLKSFDQGYDDCLGCTSHHVDVMYLPCRHRTCQGCFIKTANKYGRVVCDRCHNLVDTTQIRFLSAASVIQEIKLDNGKFIRFGPSKVDRLQSIKI